MHSIWSLLAPEHCVHCLEPLAMSHKLLCQCCFDQLDLLCSINRCPFCFCELTHAGGCDRCKGNLRSFDYLASAFEYMGPAKTLIHELKYRNHPTLAKTCAAFLLLQLHELRWPTPDVITYIPQSFLRALDRGYNQSELMALGLGIFLQRPVARLLKKVSPTLSQTSVTAEERKKLSDEHFALKKQNKVILEDAVILLIDDVCTTGTTLERAASILRAYCPKRIYALTFCHTE